MNVEKMHCSQVTNHKTRETTFFDTTVLSAFITRQNTARNIFLGIG